MSFGDQIFGPSPQTADDYRVLADEALSKAETMKNPEHAIAHGLRGIGYAILAAIAPEQVHVQRSETPVDLLGEVGDGSQV